LRGLARGLAHGLRLDRLDGRQRRTLLAAVLGNVALVGGIAGWIAWARMPADPAAGPAKPTLCDVMQVQIQPRVARTGHDPTPEKPEGEGPSPGGLACRLSRELTRH
jgi:hypothetical protein